MKSHVVHLEANPRLMVKDGKPYRSAPNVTGLPVLPPVKQLVRAAIFWMLLRPLIVRNYGKRARGTAPDEPYWADFQAFCWGYGVA